MKFLISLWRTPSSFDGDPRGFAVNQVGHGYVFGGVLPYLCMTALGLSPWLAILAYLMLVELVQVIRFSGSLWDGVEDFANVQVVGFAVAHHDPGFLLVHAVYLIAGILRRAHQQSKNGGRDGHQSNG